MKTNQIKVGAVLSYVQMALNIIIGLVYTPVMLRLLGQSEYGLYNTVSSTISILSILSLGFNSGYIRYYSKYKANQDEESIKKLNGLFLIIFLIIGFVALFCGLFLSFNLRIVFANGLTASEYEIAKVLMLLLTVNLAVSFPASVFQNIIFSREKFLFLKLIGMIRTVLSPLITLPLLLAGFRSIAMVVVTVAVSFVVDFIYILYSTKRLSVRFKFSGFEKGLFKSLFVFTSFIAINLIVNEINTSMGKFLLGRYVGTAAVAVYSVGFTLYQYYLMFSNAISGLFTPKIHGLVISTNSNLALQKTELTNIFTKVGRIQFFLLMLISTGVLFFGKPFIALWAGEGYEDSYFVALMLIFSSTIPLIQNLGIEIQRAQNRHKFRSLSYFIMAILNLIVTVILCQKYGAIGTSIGTAASMIVANGFIMNIYYHKKCNLDIITFWKNILRASLGLLIPVAFGFVINYLFDLYSIFNLALGIFVYTLVYCVSIWFLGMNNYERTLLAKPLKRIFSR